MRFLNRALGPFFLTTVSLVVTVLVMSSEPSVAQTLTAQPGLTETFPYQARIEGIEGEDDLVEALETVSISFGSIDDPPGTRAGLNRRAEADLERFRQVLSSRGFYNATVNYRVDGVVEDSVEGSTLPVLVFDVDTGGAFVLADILIVETNSPGDPEPADDELLAILGIEIGMMTSADLVLGAEAKLARHYQSTGYPFAKVESRRAVINRENLTQTVTFTLKTGPLAYFDTLQIIGLNEVDDAVVQRAVAWETNDLYDIRVVERTQRSILETGLFRVVTVYPTGEEQMAARDYVPMVTEVKEAAHRSFGAQLTFATDIGPGVETYWEHRNFEGGGEKIRLSAEASSLEAGFGLDFRKPAYPNDKTTLVAEGEFKQTNSDAFDELHLSSFVGLEHQLSNRWRLTAGPTFEIADQDDTETEGGLVLLAGLRGIARRDNSNDPLNPSKGSRLEFVVEPYHDFGETESTFLSTSALGSAYLAIDYDADFILAGRVQVGTILGAERDRIPASKRFYSGGGGSIRGYGFQELGPLDTDNDPLGGRSIFEVGVELRTRITETIGIVPFVEAGNVYESEIPFDDPSEEDDLRYSAGLGFRYFTGIGPVRADIAFPIEKRPDIDDDFQFYVSFGQAF